MKLLGAAGSPFVSRVKFALKLKSIEYDYVEEDLLNKSDLLLTSNPVFQQVPVLFHGNDQQPMIESLAIMEYLDEIKPDVYPLLPSDPFDRAQCRIMAYTFDTLVYTWMKEFMLTERTERREELKKKIVEALVMLEQSFVKLSKGKLFFGGDNIGYLDIVAGVFLWWIKFYETAFDFIVVDEARNPRLAQWGKSMWSHEVTRSVLPSDEDHMNFFNMLKSLNRVK